MSDHEVPTLANVEQLLQPFLLREMSEIHEAMEDYYGALEPAYIESKMAETRAAIIEDILHSVLLVRRIGIRNITLAQEVDLAWRARIAFLEKEEIELHDLMLRSKGALVCLRRLLRRDPQ